MSNANTTPDSRWNALADVYSTRALPGATFDYAQQIMSILSDAQHVGGIAQNSEANDYVNAAKLMLARMMDADRATWSASPKTAPCIDCGEPNATGPDLVGRTRSGQPTSGRVCEDRAACAKRISGPQAATCIDCGEPNPTGADVIGRTRTGQPTSGRRCEDQIACAKRISGPQ